MSIEKRGNVLGGHQMQDLYVGVVHSDGIEYPPQAFAIARELCGQSGSSSLYASILSEMETGSKHARTIVELIPGASGEVSIKELQWLLDNTEQSTLNDYIRVMSSVHELSKLIKGAVHAHTGTILGKSAINAPQ